VPSRRSYRVAFIASLALIVLALVFLFVEGSTPQEVILTLTALVGAIAIWFQMKRARDIAEGGFISTLNESFSSTGDVKALYGKLIDGADIGKSDRTAIAEYLTFFETIYVLLERDVVDMRLIDDLFRYRFFLAVNNEHVQNLELLPDARFYKNIYALHNMWIRYRSKDGDADDSPTALQNRDPDYQAHVKGRRHGP
jgi:hypothetical protein